MLYQDILTSLVGLESSKTCWSSTRLHLKWMNTNQRYAPERNIWKFSVFALRPSTQILAAADWAGAKLRISRAATSAKWYKMTWKVLNWLIDYCFICFMVICGYVKFHFISFYVLDFLPKKAFKKPSVSLEPRLQVWPQLSTQQCVHLKLQCPRHTRHLHHCNMAEKLRIQRPALEAKTPWCNLWSMNRKSKIVPKKIGTFLEHLANVVIEIADLKHLINDMTENPVKTWISGSFVVCTQRYGTAKPCTFCMSGLPGAGKCDTVCFFHL